MFKWYHLKAAALWYNGVTTRDYRSPAGKPTRGRIILAVGFTVHIFGGKNMAERGSRVRGAQTIKFRADWHYRIPHVEWVGRINLLRRAYGDPFVSQLLGYAATDPTFKSLRRLTDGSRLPNQKRYDIVNESYRKWRARAKLIDVINEMESTFVLPLKPRYRAKADYFTKPLPPFVYRSPKRHVLKADPEAAARMVIPEYWQTCDKNGNTMPRTKRAIVLISLLVDDKSKGEEHTEIHLIRRIDAPTLAILANQIDSWIIDLPPDYPYISFFVQGVWFTYTNLRPEFTFKK